MATITAKPLKIMFHSMDGVGHINACVGLAQALQKRGHEIIFLCSPYFVGSFAKHGFREIVLVSETAKKQMAAQSTGTAEKEEEEDGVQNSKPHPLKAMSNLLEELRKNGMLSGKSSLEKLDAFDPNRKDSFMLKMSEEMREIHPQIVSAIQREQPDLIIVDHFLVAPCIAYGRRPWAFLFSGNPSFLFQSKLLPPIMSGYPSDDRTGWDEFNAKAETAFKAGTRQFQNKLNREFGYPEVAADQYLFKSPHMNIYGYPEELDYQDVVGLPENFVRMDAFCLESPEPFEIPEEFRSKLKPGEDKLVYLSMGSMGSIDVDLMRKITTGLAKSPYKFIVSKGPLHEQYALPENMWGQAFLPQTKILPLVDMVITHGGNNTVTETMTFGKPMLVMPLFGDQYDNAQRILEKGYGYRLNPYECSDEELCKMVDKILNDPDMIEKAAKASERIRCSDSKQKACEKIEKIVREIQC